MGPVRAATKCWAALALAVPAPAALATLATLALVTLAGPAACAPDPGAAGAAGVAARPIVYGADDRREYFEVDRPDVRARVAASAVALVRRSQLRQGPAGVVVTAQPWAEAAGLCPGERFAEQPSAAFCSGVLVDWDLVLTAGHCTRAFALDDFVVVFGYYYAQPGQLAVAREDVHDIEEIAAEALGPAGPRPRIAYAWLRLRRRVQPPRAPAPIRLSTAGLARGQPLLFAAAGGGLPIKIDAGGAIADLGEPWSDYLVASTDSLHGASGGGAFDAGLALVGALERGGRDFVMTDQGCRATFVAADDRAEEELTFAHRAREALCAADPAASSLCRPDCGDPCAALPPPAPPPEGGCALAPAPGGPSRPSAGAWSILLACACWLLVRAPAGVGRRPGHTSPPRGPPRRPEHRG
jgi:hypothetical protein